MSQSAQKTQTAATFDFEDQLPKLPLPAFDDTCCLFLEWCAPLLTEEELRSTHAVLEKFADENGIARKAHEKLIAYNNHTDTQSWLDSFWRTRYYGRRDPIALNANYAFLMSRQQSDQIESAAQLISKVLLYKTLLDRQEIAPAIMGDAALSMAQQKWLFAASRLPGAEIDSLLSAFGEKDEDAIRHIVVFYKDHITKLDVLDEDLKVIHPEKLKKALGEVMAQADAQEGTGDGVGAMTTQARAKWAELRQQLSSTSQKNIALLREVETALFAVNLEELNPENDLARVDNMLHSHAKNRWFDKSLQFIIFGDGSHGVNVEHCELDGTTVVGLVETLGALEISRDHEPWPGYFSTQGNFENTRLAFDLTPELTDAIERAATEFADLSYQAATDVFDFDDFGSAQIKQLKISPDAYFQLALQVAQKRTKGFIGATYESIATRRFKAGRTEAMRVVTPQIANFIEAIDKEDISGEEKASLLRDAANAHIERAKGCQTGRAPEQHLWELLNIFNKDPNSFVEGLSDTDQQALKDNFTALFETPGWIKMRSDVLSTSSAPTKSAHYFGFGSTGPGCIGVGYIIGKEHIAAYLSTSRSQEADLGIFKEKLASALHEIGDILAKSSS